jgi:hypothetical protein
MRCRVQSATDLILYCELKLEDIDRLAPVLGGTECQSVHRPHANTNRGELTIVSCSLTEQCCAPKASSTR